MKKVFSKRWTLNLWDLSRTVLLTFITSALDLIYQAGAMWIQDRTNPIDWQHIAVVAGITALGYLIKNFSTKIPDKAIEHAAKEQGIINHK